MYTVIKTSQWCMLKHGTCILKCDDSENSNHLQWNMTELMEGGLPVPACLYPHHQQMCNKSNHQGTAYTGNRTMMGNGVELRGPTAVGFSDKAVNSRHPLQILVRLLVSKLKFPVAFISLYELAIHLQTGNNQLPKSYLKVIHEHLPVL